MKRIPDHRPGNAAKASLWTVVFVLLALGLPAFALRFDAPLGWVASTLLLCGGILAASGSLSPPRLGQVAAGLGAASMAAANALVAVSYYLQGDGVNEIFLFHFHPDVLEVLPAYKGMLGAASIYVVLVVLSALGATREPRFRLPKIVSIVLLLMSLAMFTPARQLMGTLDVFSIGESDPAAEELLSKLDEGGVSATDEEPPAELLDAVEAVAVPPESPRNLVLIYLEGLEQVYLDETRFPGLMPRLRELQKETITFTNMHGEFLGGTIFGIFASQCGWPLHWELFKSTRSGDVFLPELRCLGDALEEKGYTSVFMGGAPIRFGRKDIFFQSHGFSKVLGKRALRERLPDPGYIHQWGLHDDSLFDLAGDELQGLADSQPFFLNLITVGTHYPGYVSSSCPDYGASDDGVLKAAHCTDFLVARFIETIRRSETAENTVIAVMSDHLMWDGGARDHELGLRLARPMIFMVEVPGEKGQVNSNHGTHFDVPATLLSVLEVGFEGRFGLGTTLMDGDGFLWTEKAYRDDAGRALQSDIERSKAIKTFLASREVRNFVEEFSR